jgi:hypothetical protein
VRDLSGLDGIDKKMLLASALLKKAIIRAK